MIQLLLVIHAWKKTSVTLMLVAHLVMQVQQSMFSDANFWQSDAA